LKHSWQQKNTMIFASSTTWCKTALPTSFSRRTLWQRIERLSTRPVSTLALALMDIAPVRKRNCIDSVSLRQEDALLLK
jgi:hypothetical protein